MIIGIMLGILIGSLSGVYISWKINEYWSNHCLKLNHDWKVYCEKLINEFYDKAGDTE